MEGMCKKCSVNCGGFIIRGGFVQKTVNLQAALQKTQSQGKQKGERGCSPGKFYILPYKRAIFRAET